MAADAVRPFAAVTRMRGLAMEHRLDQGELSGRRGLGDVADALRPARQEFDQRSGRRSRGRGAPEPVTGPNGTILPHGDAKARVDDDLPDLRGGHEVAVVAIERPRRWP